MLTNSTKNQQMQKCTPPKKIMLEQKVVYVFHIIGWAKKLSASSLMTLLSREHKTMRFET